MLTVSQRSLGAGPTYMCTRISLQDPKSISVQKEHAKNGITWATKIRNLELGVPFIQVGELKIFEKIPRFPVPQESLGTPCSLQNLPTHFQSTLIYIYIYIHTSNVYQFHILNHRNIMSSSLKTKGDESSTPTEIDQRPGQKMYNLAAVKMNSRACQ